MDSYCTPPDVEEVALAAGTFLIPDDTISDREEFDLEHTTQEEEVTNDYNVFEQNNLSTEIDNPTDDSDSEDNVPLAQLLPQATSLQKKKKPTILLKWTRTVTKQIDSTCNVSFSEPEKHRNSSTRNH
ncbi:hypothetical protein PPYR_02259 [Photinus pyralis]|uniref:Uncharacterized protein n=1 Tax=Photinus pyralis TaxID=7054 RepID=A0A5N3ZZZ0_PHOPY|nr:hypothetical protein PPYR_15007 [Photinus pyralis]KAB0803094.1 hypothetical protein PPYR_00064 [Photinus pyralis]KAB0805289.1 hypothetical protein PPYR_02259 [Photinus pyralis]